MQQIKYEDLTLQPYLKSEIFRPKIAKILTALRSKCVQGIKHNFPNQFKNCKKCPLQCDEQDTQEHVIVCAKLGGSSNLQLDLVFGDIAQQKQIATLYHECMKKRMTIVE